MSPLPLSSCVILSGSCCSEESRWTLLRPALLTLVVLIQPSISFRIEVILSLGRPDVFVVQSSKLCPCGRHSLLAPRASNILTNGTWPPCAARERAVSPDLFILSRSAPLEIRRWPIRELPASAANINNVQPYLFERLGLTPPSSAWRIERRSPTLMSRCAPSKFNERRHSISSLFRAAFFFHRHFVPQ
jgi:hypothetical protein